MTQHRTLTRLARGSRDTGGEGEKDEEGGKARGGAGTARVAGLLADVETRLNQVNRDLTKEIAKVRNEYQRWFVAHYSYT